MLLLFTVLLLKAAVDSPPLWKFDPMQKNILQST